MIERHVFIREWQKLEARFGKSYPKEVTGAYYEALASQLETEEFVMAARALFFASEFFPKPGDFFTVGAEAQWPMVVECIHGYCPPAWKWTEDWETLSPRAQDACRALGGMDAMKRMYERDALRARNAFLDAYGSVALSQVFPALAPGAGHEKALPAAQDQEGDEVTPQSREIMKKLMAGG